MNPILNTLINIDSADIYTTRSPKLKIPKYVWVVYINRLSGYNRDIPRAMIFTTLKKANQFIKENPDIIEEYHNKNRNWTKTPEKVKIYE